MTKCGGNEGLENHKSIGQNALNGGSRCCCVVVLKVVAQSNKRIEPIPFNRDMQRFKTILDVLHIDGLAAGTNERNGPIRAKRRTQPLLQENFV